MLAYEGKAINTVNKKIRFCGIAMIRMLELEYAARHAYSKPP